MYRDYKFHIEGKVHIHNIWSMYGEDGQYIKRMVHVYRKVGPWIERIVHGQRR